MAHVHAVCLTHSESVPSSLGPESRRSKQMIDAMHWARSGMASAPSSCVPTTQGKQLQKAGKGSFPFLRPFAPTLYSLQCFPSCFIIGEEKKDHISHSPQHSRPGLHFLTKFKVSKFTSPYIEVHNLLLTPWYIELTQTVIFPTFCSPLGSFITLQTLQRNVTMFSGHRPVMIGAARAWASIAQG